MADNECVPFKKPAADETFYASAAVTGKRFVKITGDRTSGPGLADSFDTANWQAGPCGNGERACGVAKYDVAEGDLGGFVTAGVVPVTAGSTITAGDAVQSDAQGRAIPVSAAVHASYASGSTGSNNAITWTAVSEGAGPNGVTVVIANPGADGDLSVAVADETITVTAAYASSAITSTAADVIAAVNADPDASALVHAANTTGSSGAGLVAAFSHALSGGVDPTPDAEVLGYARSGAAASDDAPIKLNL